MSYTHNMLQYEVKPMKDIGLNLRLQTFSFSNCNTDPNPTHLPKHQILSPNHDFSQRI